VQGVHSLQRRHKKRRCGELLLLLLHMEWRVMLLWLCCYGSFVSYMAKQRAPEKLLTVDRAAISGNW
jgi:hypothetical protein